MKRLRYAAFCILSAFSFLFGNASAHEARAEGSAAPGAPQQTGRLITIAEGIRIVLKDSRLIKMAAAEKDISFDDALASRSVLLPQVSGFAAQTFLNNQPIAKFNLVQAPTAEKSSFSYGLQVYQTLFDFKRGILTHQAALANVNAQQAVLEQTRRVAVMEFIIAYFDLLESEKMIQVARQEVETIAAYAADVEHLYAQGAAIKNDLLAAQLRLADARQRLISARNLREMAQTRLVTMLALPLEEPVRVQDIRMGVPAIGTLEDAWQRSERQRPEIAVIDGQMAATDARRRATLTGNLPELYADGGYRYDQNKYQVHEDNLYVNLGAKVNLFDGWQTRAEASKESDRIRQLAQQRSKLLDDIRMEVKDSYLGVQDAIDRVSVSKDGVSQSEENVRINRSGYAEGAATATQVLDAIAQQTVSQTNYYRADYQLKREYTKLMYSTGIDLALVYETIEKGDRGDGKQ